MRKLYPYLLLALSVLTFTQSKAQVNKNDSLALVDLYNNTNGPSWYNHTNWLTSAPVSSWYGIIITSSRITELYLNSNGLDGLFPASVIQLDNLNILDLSGNRLSGNLPSSLSKLVKLTQFRVDGNRLSDTIPSSFGKLINLTVLGLGDNQLSGSIPSSLSRLKNMYLLLLSVNKLSGSIPSSLGNLANLAALELSDNQLNGVIPPSFSKLTKIVELTLSYNQLSGNINFLSELKGLGYLDLNNNNLSGNLQALSQLDTLTYISLNHNQFSGSIPSFKKRRGVFASSIFIDLSYNNLQGRITHQLDSLTNIGYMSFRVNNNKITGGIPTIISKLISLNDIDLSNNNLTGKVPSLDSLKNLNSFNISNNLLSGSAPTFSPLARVFSPHIENNKFNFLGMEGFAKINGSVYAPQANLIINQNGNLLSVDAGGTISNNTYKWYRNGKPYRTKVGNATLTASNDGAFTVEVTNSVATQLTLKSDTVNYAAFHNTVTSATINTLKSAYIFPNPATTVTTVYFTAIGKYTITVTDASGKVIKTKTDVAANYHNYIQLEVNGYASGIYLIKIIDEKNNMQTLRLNKQ